MYVCMYICIYIHQVCFCLVSLIQSGFSCLVSLGPESPEGIQKARLLKIHAPDRGAET